jgi:hypothetical protein
MPTLRTYSLFISHAWVYNDDYYRLVDLLNQAPNFSWRNYSVPSHDGLDAGNARELQDALDRQISPTHCVLIVAGMYVAHREWLQKEVQMAQSYGKPIIGIQPWGSHNTPSLVSEAAVAIVGWNTNTIVSAIRTHSI